MRQAGPTVTFGGMDERVDYSKMSAAGVVQVMAYLVRRYGWNENDSQLSKDGRRGISVCGAFNRACGSSTIWRVGEPTDAQQAAWMALFTEDLLDSNLHNDFELRRRTTADIVGSLEAVQLRLSRQARAGQN